MKIEADRGDVGVRIDRVLLRHLAHVPGVSRNRLQKLLAAGGVRVNGSAPPRISWRVAAGDQIEIDLPRRAERKPPAAETLPLAILHEDADLLVVDKPPGQVAHPAFRNTSGTLLNAILGYAGGRWTPALLTRLDRDTSGLVLVAKRPDVQRALQRSLEGGGTKEYLAVVRGRPTPARGVIDLALDRDPWDRRRVMVRDRGGQRSVTRYARLASNADGTASLLRCRLITGRTHQIRVHLQARGWPIIGDAAYGVKDARLGRQALHAWRLTFTQPLTGETVAVSSPLPDDMRQLLAALSLDAGDL